MAPQGAGERQVVRVKRAAGVAVIVIDNPPINASSAEVRRGLLAAVQQAGGDPAVTALVLIGAGSTFIAGADLREFGRPLEDPQLPDVIAAVEACAKPVVAALHGTALGAGFELALACDARIALASSVIGFPAVTLGIIPGAGGTQRLPRIVGIPKAIAMICSGERVSAGAALALRLVDRVVEAGLREQAIALALGLEAKARVRDRSVPPTPGEEIEATAAAALRAGKRRPAVLAAIESIKAAATLPIDDALAQARAAFHTLRAGPDAHALRYQFFAEREAARCPQADTAAPRPLRSVAVVGAGTMGTGIALAALDAGLEVMLLDRDQGALEAGLARIHQYHAGRVKAGRMREVQVSEREGRLGVGTNWSVVAGADLVIEAVFEDLEVKCEVFRLLDEVASPGTVLATNTSYMDLDAIAAATSRPQDVIGLHFFSPANVMRLLEVVRGSATAPDVLATGLALARRLGKQAVVAGNSFGFVGNRIYAAYRRQCEFMLEEGATPRQVDAALEAFGFAMGPFAVGDMSGLDIAWRMRKSLAAARDPEARYVRIPDVLCEAGRLGRKTGAGYYTYPQDSAARVDDPVVLAMIESTRIEKGIAVRPLANREIVERALLAMACEASRLLADGVAQRPGDIDVVMANGYGFPKWEGGPLWWARARGLDNLVRDFEWLAVLSGPGFARGDAHQLFKR